jgi:DNA segregation ATPase FtsK/SpoIIIE-like protein
LPNKIILEPYERDIIGLIEEAIYRNRKIEDKNWNEKYIAKMAEAKARLEKYQAEKEEQNCCILAHFFDSLKILEDHKKINTALIQRKLRIGYGEAAKIIDSLFALSLIKKSEDEAKCYCLNTDEKEFSEIVNAYINNFLKG